MDMDEIQEMLNQEGYEYWVVVDDSVIICPCGNQIEWDGMCPDGCISPLMELGLI